MNYAGTCVNKHSFEGNLDTPKGIGRLPNSFAERCPVPYCPHFITYKRKEVNMDDFNAHLASDIYGLMDRLTTLARRLTGVPGYEPINRKKIVKELGDAQADIQAIRTAALQPE